MEEESSRSPFASLPLHDTWFDWSDETLTPNDISKKLMGTVGYWEHPDFSAVLDEDGEEVSPALEPHEIEREILLEAGRDAWYSESSYGKPYYQHFLTLMALMDDKTDITPTMADFVRAFCMSFHYGIKVVNLIGSQNGGKSAGSSRAAMVCLYIDPEFTAIYVANPFNNTADSTIWGDILEMWDNICDTHPHESKERATSLFPNGYVYQDRYITVTGTAKAGFIKLQDPKKESKFKGSKTKGKETDRGLIVHVVDEINEINDTAYLNVLPNLSSQPGFICITSQNFKSEEDMGGLICEPFSRWDDDPSSYEELDIEEHHVWSSAYRSVTIRFDGKRAANMQAKRTVYGYLFKQEDWDRLAELGIDSPDFYSQARSFPIRGESDNSVLPKSKISNSQHKDSWFTVLGQPTRVAFCDPAFGGRDRAKWGYAEFSPCLVKQHDGSNKKVTIFNVKDYFKTLKIVKDAIYNEYWIDRMEKAGIFNPDVVMGGEVSPESQIAIQCAELNSQHGIPAENFGFDFSMKPDVVTGMYNFVGTGSVAFDYNQPPLGYELQSFKTNSSEYCKDRVSELCFIIADLMVGRQLRGGQYCQTGILQLSRTRYELVGKSMRACEKKKEFKKRWKNESPDDRDVLVGLGGMAAMRGLSTKSIVTFTSSSNVMSKVQKKFRKPRARRI